MLFKSKLLSTSLLSLSILTLVACSSTTSEKQDTTVKTEQTSSSKLTDEKVQDRAKKDAKTLLTAMLTKNDNGFSRIYGDDYQTWSNDINANAAVERVNELGFTPENKWTITYYDAPLTPTQLMTNFLETRRNMLQKIEDFDVKNVSVEDEDTVTVSAEMHGINSLEMARTTRELKGKVLSDDFTLFVAESDSEDLDKLDSLINFYLVDGLYGRKFLGLGVPVVDIPLTSGNIQVDFTLRRDGDGHWTISEKDYRSLVSDLMVSE